MSSYARSAAGWTAPCLAFAMGLALADSVDRAQLGMGMGGVGAMMGATAGPAGALVGGVVGVAVGAKMADDPRYNPGEDPARQREVQAERARWKADRRASEERLRDEQRQAFETRLAANSSQGSGMPSGTEPRAEGPSTALVQQIQRGLARVGYEPGALDGHVSPETVAAIEAFQRDHRLTVDGVPSRPLLDSIRAAGG